MHADMRAAAAPCMRCSQNASARRPISSLARVLFYHLGSIAFGSFIIALVQFIRVCLEVVDHQTKKLQARPPTRRDLVPTRQSSLPLPP